MPISGFVTISCFNTQPPEGGWARTRGLHRQRLGFNTQPPEGGWACGLLVCFPLEVSTHSRPKAAGT